MTGAVLLTEFAGVTDTDIEGNYRGWVRGDACATALKTGYQDLPQEIDTFPAYLLPMQLYK